MPVVVRHYRLNAAEGKSAELAASLSELASALKLLPGFLSAEVLVGVDRPHDFVFVEKWASVEARRDCAPQMPKAIMASIMSAVAGPPDVTDLAYLRPE